MVVLIKRRISPKWAYRGLLLLNPFIGILTLEPGWDFIHFLLDVTTPDRWTYHGLIHLT